MMDLDAKEVVSTLKTIDLDIEIFAEKTIMTLVFNINGSGIYTIMALINQDIMVLFQIIVLEFKI